MSSQYTERPPELLPLLNDIKRALEASYFFYDSAFLAKLDTVRGMLTPPHAQPVADLVHDRDWGSVITTALKLGALAVYYQDVADEELAYRMTERIAQWYGNTPVAGDGELTVRYLTDLDQSRTGSPNIHAPGDVWESAKKLAYELVNPSGLSSGAEEKNLRFEKAFRDANAMNPLSPEELVAAMFEITQAAVREIRRR